MKAREVGVETRPVEGVDLRLDGGRVGVLGLGIDLGLRVEGVEDEAGGHRGVDVFQLLQVIRVTADGLRPAGLEGAPGRVVQHIARGPVAAPHLPDGLLREDGSDRCARPRSARGRGPASPAPAGRRSRRRYAGRCGTGSATAGPPAAPRALSAVVSATRRAVPSSRFDIPGEAVEDRRVARPRPPSACPRHRPVPASRWRLRGKPVIRGRRRRPAGRQRKDRVTRVARSWCPFSWSGPAGEAGSAFQSNVEDLVRGVNHSCRTQPRCEPRAPGSPSPHPAWRGRTRGRRVERCRGSAPVRGAAR